MANTWYRDAQKSKNEDIKSLMSRYKNADKNMKATLKIEIVALLEKNPEPKNKPNKKDKLMDEMQDLALNPRLANIGITREEELFIKNVIIRPMTRDERILMRRSIYQKKNAYSAKLSSEYKVKRNEQRVKALNDPKTIAYNNRMKHVKNIRDGLTRNMNIGTMLKTYPGLTIEIIDELTNDKSITSQFTELQPKFPEQVQKYRTMYNK